MFSKYACCTNVSTAANSSTVTLEKWEKSKRNRSGLQMNLIDLHVSLKPLLRQHVTNVLQYDCEQYPVVLQYLLSIYSIADFQ